MHNLYVFFTTNGGVFTYTYKAEMHKLYIYFISKFSGYTSITDK